MNNLINNLIQKETNRQKKQLRLIASENYTSPDIHRAMSSVLANKYSEGYPGKRYYQGQEYYDEIENLAINGACEIFNAEHANVQPYSGSPANLAVYYALLELGDTILGMGLPAGGHLTHGWNVNFSGRFYNSYYYGLNSDSEKLDYDEIRKIALKIKPKLIIAGASAYPRQIDFEKFNLIAKEVNAYLLADIAHISGLVATNNHPQPFPYADVVTTTTHKTLRGPRGGLIMCKKQLSEKIDKAVFPALQGGPHMHNIAAKAIAFDEAKQPNFKIYIENVINNAKILAESLKNYGFRIVTDGTDNHIVLVDVSNFNISGKDAAKKLEKVGIIVNANSVPFDKRGPFNPSGIRLGTAAITTRGMNELDMKTIAFMINEAITGNNVDKLKQKVESFCTSFPTFKK
jgi:glycine hydroxymethyltransferase